MWTFGAKFLRMPYFAIHRMDQVGLALLSG
jgi:hypothetical protein